MQNSIKKGRVDIETLYLVEKGALLFLSVNLIAASLGVDKLSWSENSETEFIFGWNSWIQTDTSNAGVTVIRDRDYGSSDCTLGSCDANKEAGMTFFVLNMMALFLLAFCCIISIEMAIFHYTNYYKKILNAIMAILAFMFNLTAWCNWKANSNSTGISQANAGNSTMVASSFWYNVLACIFLFLYCILVLKQNLVNFQDKRKPREEVKPRRSDDVPTARYGREHENKNITKLLQSRIITSERDPTPPNVPDIPRKLTAEIDEDSVKVLPPPVPTLALRNLPPPLPPRTSKESLTPVERVSSTQIGVRRKRSRGLPSVRTVAVVPEDSGASSREESWDDVGT